MADLKPGTSLSRDWHGKTLPCAGVDEGFLFEIGAIVHCRKSANAITGPNGPGPRFFGACGNRKGVDRKSKPGGATMSCRHRQNPMGRGEGAKLSAVLLYDRKINRGGLEQADLNSLVLRQKPALPI